MHSTPSICGVAIRVAALVSMFALQPCRTAATTITSTPPPGPILEGTPGSVAYSVINDNTFAVTIILVADPALTGGLDDSPVDDVLVSPKLDLTTIGCTPGLVLAAKTPTTFAKCDFTVTFRTDDLNPTRDTKPDFNRYTITEKVRTKNMKTGVELPVAENATNVIVIDKGAKVPEPSTLLLLAASLGALALIRARRF